MLTRVAGIISQVFLSGQIKRDKLLPWHFFFQFSFNILDTG